MNKKRLRQLQNYAHDCSIATQAAADNGKIIPNLNDIALLWETVEKVAKACQEEPL